MTRTKEKVLRGANEGSFRWVQIKYQLNNASQALVVARNKSMTVAFLGKMLTCILNIYTHCSLTLKSGSQGLGQ